MIVRTKSGNREIRSFGPNTAIAPRVAGHTAVSGETVTPSAALGLSPFGRAVRLVAGVIASLPLQVFEGTGGERRPRPDTPQARLLEQPVAGMSVFDWRYDIAASLETGENAFLLKLRDRTGRVVELQPLPAGMVAGWLDRDGSKVYDVWTPDGRARLTSLDVLHIRGQTVDGGPFGVSRLLQHTDPVGSMLAAQRFEGSYYRHHARPDVALIFPEHVTQEKAREWRVFWDSEYGGAGNAGKAVPLGAGATIQPIPGSMRDSQFIEGRQFNLTEAGRIMDLDAALLGAAENSDVRKTALEMFLKLQLPPRLRRIELALKADMDLFDLASPLYPQFVVDDLMFADPLTRAQVHHVQVQDGTLLVDEARADMGRPPLPDGVGQIPQITPVGGAPNPEPPPTDPTDPEL